MNLSESKICKIYNSAQIFIVIKSFENLYKLVEQENVDAAKDFNYVIKPLPKFLRTIHLSSAFSRI